MPKGELGFFILAFLATLAFREGQGGLAPRIVNGVKIKRYDALFFAEILYNGFPFCGGAFIDINIVITAAHCAWERDWHLLSVQVGSDKINGPTKVVLGVIGFADMGYIRKLKEKDVVILMVNATNEQLKDIVKPIAIEKDCNSMSDHDRNNDPDCEDSDSDDTEEQKCKVTGFGLQSYHGKSSEDLRQAIVTVHNGQVCSAMFEGHTKLFNREIEVCAGGKKTDACQGDSGGPLTCINKKGVEVLKGIVSWGIKCATKDVPGTYVKLSKFIKELNCKIRHRLLGNDPHYPCPVTQGSTKVNGSEVSTP